MMLMVRKAGMALVMLFQSIWAALIIIRDPVRISAGPVQYTGMEAAWQRNVLSPHIGLGGDVNTIIITLGCGIAEKQRSSQD